MATPEDVFEFIKALDFADGILTLSPGPFRIAVGESDQQAAEFITWWSEKYPEARLSDLFAMLDNVRWWALFWVAVQEAEQRKEAEDGR